MQQDAAGEDQRLVFAASRARGRTGPRPANDASRQCTGPCGPRARSSSTAAAQGLHRASGTTLTVRLSQGPSSKTKRRRVNLVGGGQRGCGYSGGTDAADCSIKVPESFASSTQQWIVLKNAK
jgi:hypothetical protein